jgi:hypothetical protein
MEENIEKQVIKSEGLLKGSNVNNDNPPPPNHMFKSVDNPPITYIEVITEKDEEGQPVSVLEVDLVISREKGKETRRLSMSFTGIDFEKKEMIEKSVNLDKESFEFLKKFFTQLDWNS